MAYEENPEEYVKKEVCPTCPHYENISNPLLFKLLDYLALIDAGCPIGRHELRNEEWRALGILREERGKVAIERSKKDQNGQYSGYKTYYQR